jgi:hypothetical protein
MGLGTLETVGKDQKAIDGIENAETYEYSLKVQFHQGEMDLDSMPEACISDISMARPVALLGKNDWSCYSLSTKRKRKKLGPLDRRKRPFQTFIYSYSYKTFGQFSVTRT